MFIVEVNKFILHIHFSQNVFIKAFHMISRDRKSFQDACGGKLLYRIVSN